MCRNFIRHFAICRKIILPVRISLYWRPHLRLLLPCYKVLGAWYGLPVLEGGGLLYSIGCGHYGQLVLTVKGIMASAASVLVYLYIHALNERWDFRWKIAFWVWLVEGAGVGTTTRLKWVGKMLRKSMSTQYGAQAITQCQCGMQMIGRLGTCPLV